MCIKRIVCHFRGHQGEPIKPIAMHLGTYQGNLSGLITELDTGLATVYRCRRCGFTWIGRAPSEHVNCRCILGALVDEIRM